MDTFQYTTYELKSSGTGVVGDSECKFRVVQRRDVCVDVGIDHSEDHALHVQLHDAVSERSHLTDYNETPSHRNV